MMESGLEVRRIGMDEIDAVRELFAGVFTAAPWYDDWSDQTQLVSYLADLMDQRNSLTYGLYGDGQLLGVSMGRIMHWYSGTEYCIDELCIRTDVQGMGLGTAFLRRIERGIRALGLTHIFLLTERTVPAYTFYGKNGFQELKDNVAFAKRV